MSLRKNFIFVFIIIGIISLCSCQMDLNDTIQKKSNTNYTVRIIVSASNRTILPTGFVGASYTLAGVFSDNSTKTWTFTSLSDLQSASIQLLSGTWTFTLDAVMNNNTVASARISQTITSETASLTFCFDSGSISYTEGTGSISVELTYPASGKVAVVTGALYPYSDPTTIVADTTKTLIRAADTVANTYTVCYSNTAVSAGNYYLVFKLYQDSSKAQCIATYRELVRVAGDCISSAVRTLTTLNTLYNINYELNGIELSVSYTAPASYTASQTITLPAGSNLDQTSLTFTGWYQTSDFSDTAVTGWSPNSETGDIKVYARNTAKVTFSMNSHGTAIADQTIVYGRTITEPADPTDSGYFFKGWFSDSSLSSKYDFTTAVTQNTVLYAKWIDETTYNATYVWSYPTTTPTLTWTGSGTSASPYVISTAQQLADLAYMVNNGTSYSSTYFQLGADIDLNEGYTVTGTNESYNQWKPIGLNSSYCFEGVFDGNYHTVTGVYIDSPSYPYTGLFGYTSGATIKRLTVGEGYICNTYCAVNKDYSYAGGIVGDADSGMIYDCCGIVNIEVTGGGYYKYWVSKTYSDGSASLTPYERYNYTYAGGIAGADSSTVCNCYNEGTITGGATYSYIGGISGYNSSSLTNCYNNGSLSGATIGGLIGYNSSGTIYYSYYLSKCGATDVCGENLGTVTSCSSFTSPTVAMSGLAGYNGLLLYVLNRWVSDNSGYSAWTAGTDGYPELSSKQ
jgi:uncharacterized repeat protein (TIGR02543 family)